LIRDSRLEDSRLNEVPGKRNRKTIQKKSVFGTNSGGDIAKCTLIVASKSAMGQWQQEIKKHFVIRYSIFF